MSEKEIRSQYLEDAADLLRIAERLYKAAGYVEEVSDLRTIRVTILKLEKPEFTTSPEKF